MAVRDFRMGVNFFRLLFVFLSLLQLILGLAVF